MSTVCGARPMPWVILVASLCIFVSQAQAAGKFYGYNAAAWMAGFDSAAYDNGSAEAATDANDYTEHNYEKYDTLGMVPLRTITELAGKLGGVNCAGLSTHGEDDGTMYMEFFCGGFDPSWQWQTSRTLAEASRTSQGLAAADFPVWWSTTTDVAALVMKSSGISTFLAGHSWGIPAILVLEVCNGYQNLDEFAHASTTFVGVGYNFTVTPGTSNSVLTSFYNRLGCQQEGGAYLDHVNEAAAGLNTGFLVYDPNSLNPRLNPNCSCSSDDDEFVVAGMYGGFAYWGGAFETGTEFKIRGYQSLSSAPVEIVTLKAIPSEPDNWGGFYSCRVPEQFVCFDILSVGPRGAIAYSRSFSEDSSSREMEFYSRHEFWRERTPADAMKPGNQEDRQKSEQNIGVDVVVVGKSLSMISPVLTEMTRRRIANTYLANSTITAQAIVDKYHQAVSSNIVANIAAGENLWPVDPGPLLIISGSAGACDNCIPYIEYPDEDGRCGFGGVCHSDLLFTDTNGDYIPEGPVTRVPAVNPSEVGLIVDSAAAFSAGQDVDNMRRIGLFCDDFVNNYYEELVTIGDSYFPIFYSPLGILRSSALPLLADRMAAMSGLMNDGMREIFGRGKGFSSESWAGFLSTENQSQGMFAELTTQQNIVVWLPACYTGFCSAPSTGEFFFNGPVSRALFLPNSTTQHTKAAAIVGHINSGWMDQHALFAQYLAAARIAAEGSNTQIARIAYDAVRNMLEDYPGYLQHVLGVETLGAYTSLPTPSATQVPELTHDIPLVAIPNPFNPSTQIRFFAREAGPITVSVVDVRGRAVRRLVSQADQPGEVAIDWAGVDDHGQRVASGVYLVMVRVAGRDLPALKIVMLE